MSTFMQNWNDTEHKLRKELIALIENYDVKVDEFYKDEVEILLSDIKESRRLHKKKKGTAKHVRSDVIDQLAKVFCHARVVQTTLLKRLKETGAENYDEFDNKVHEYLTHLSQRINMKKTKKEHHYSEKSRAAKKANNIKGVRRYADERAEKQNPFRDIPSDEQEEHLNNNAA